MLQRQVHTVCPGSLRVCLFVCAWELGICWSALDHWGYCYVVICAAREVEGEGSDMLTVVTVAIEGGGAATLRCGSISEYGGAGNAAMPMALVSIMGGCVSAAAAAVGVVRLHIRMTSS